MWGAICILVVVVWLWLNMFKIIGGWLGGSQSEVKVNDYLEESQRLKDAHEDRCHDIGLNAVRDYPGTEYNPKTFTITLKDGTTMNTKRN